MIYGIFHKGSGLGNQLHRYVATKVLALDKGYEFGMVAPDLFKGKDFMNLDMGIEKIAPYYIEQASGKVIPNINIPVWEEWDKFTYDPDFNFVEDNTIIDGSFEDPRYFEHRMGEISEWLKTELIEIPDDVCVIGFRGGEYYTVPELGLPLSWYHEAMREMLKLNPNIKFEIHTDDPIMAVGFFNDSSIKIIKDIGINWRSIRCAKYAIIANSSFYVLPRLLNGGLTIAPRWWNRYNIKQWQYPQNYYKAFKYI